MKQEQVAKFRSDDSKIVLYCDSDTPLGVLHDFLMLIKGNIVDRMVSAHKEEQRLAELQREEENGS